MHRYEQGVVLVNRGRVIPVILPAPYETQSSAYVVGWVVDEGGR